MKKTFLFILTCSVCSVIYGMDNKINNNDKKIIPYLVKFNVPKNYLEEPSLVALEVYRQQNMPIDQALEKMKALNLIHKRSTLLQAATLRDRPSLVAYLNTHQDGAQ